MPWWDPFDSEKPRRARAAPSAPAKPEVVAIRLLLGSLNVAYPVRGRSDQWHRVSRRLDACGKSQRVEQRGFVFLGLIHCSLGQADRGQLDELAFRGPQTTEPSLIESPAAATWAGNRNVTGPLVGYDFFFARRHARRGRPSQRGCGLAGRFSRLRRGYRSLPGSTRASHRSGSRSARRRRTAYACAQHCPSTKNGSLSVRRYTPSNTRQCR